MKHEQMFHIKHLRLHPKLKPDVRIAAPYGIVALL